MKKKHITRYARQIYKTLCKITPKCKTKISFISYPDFSDNSLAIFKYLSKNYSSFDLVWLHAEPIKQKIEYSNLRLVPKNTLRGLWHFLTSAVAFNTHGSYFFADRGGPFQVCLWHGMPLKNIGYRDGKGEAEVPYADASIATSSYFRSIISESFLINEENVWVTGLPRNDWLLNPDDNVRSELIKKLNIKSTNDIIFWLPTYRISAHGEIRVDSAHSTFLSEWPEGFLHCLDRAAGKAGKCIIIKFHPMDVLNQQNLFPEFENVRLVTAEAWSALEIDLYRALSHSEALISDISSVVIDYIVTGKPIALTVNSHTAYSRGTAEKIDAIVSAVENLRTKNEFIRFIENPSDSKLDRKALADFYDTKIQDANSCARVVEHVLTKLKLNLSCEASKKG